MTGYRTYLPVVLIPRPVGRRPQRTVGFSVGHVRYALVTGQTADKLGERLLGLSGSAGTDPVLPVGQLTAKLTLVGNFNPSDCYRVPKLHAYVGHIRAFSRSSTPSAGRRLWPSKPPLETAARSTCCRPHQPCAWPVPVIC